MDQDSWVLTKVKEPIGVWHRSSAYMLWLSNFVFLRDSGGILWGFGVQCEAGVFPDSLAF